MQTALVTGLNGRLAPHLQLALESAGVDVIAFDRNELDILNRQQQAQFIAEHAIDCIFHFANGAESWLEILAGIAFENDIPFLFTSTESVFNPESRGPFTPEHSADATSDYGRYKINCEEAALKANPNSIIARLGWQMFDTFEQDNLLTHVRDMHNEKGYLEASSRWLPAVAFVDHTMQCLLDLMDAEEPGIYHVGGNESGLSFYDIACLINEKYELGWDIREGDFPARDGRIVDERVPCGDIADALMFEDLDDFDL